MNTEEIAKNLVRMAKRLLSAKSVSRDDVIEFLKKNPNPDDDAVHKWAESLGIEVDDVEEVIYKVATSFGELMTGGRSNEKNVGAEDVDAKELKLGVKIEKEHTDNPLVAEKIALDHLAEIPDYYTRLKKMEEDAGIED